MDWATTIWSAAAGASFMMALLHFFMWSQNRRAWANLCFAFTAVGALGLAAGELVSMHAESPEAFGLAVRWTHVVHAIGVVGSLGFVHFYFGTGRRWLLKLAITLRVLVVIANFASGGQSLHFTVIHSLRRVSFLGEQVSVLGEWVPSPWVILGQLASLVQLVYVMDASVRLWRSSSPESRRRATVVGGSLALFIILAVGQAGLVVAGVMRTPFIVSLPFLGLVLAMSYELSAGSAMNHRPRIVLADDHTMLLDAFRRLLEPQCDIVGTACDGRALIEVALKTEPEIIVLDISMPRLNGMDAFDQLRRQLPKAKFIFLTVHEDADLAAEAIGLGASGFLLKSSASAELTLAIENAILGRIYSPL